MPEARAMESQSGKSEGASDNGQSERVGRSGGGRGMITQGLRASRRIAIFMLNEMVERLGSEA